MFLIDMNLVWVARTALSMGRWSFLTFNSSIAILYCVHHVHDHLSMVVQRYVMLSLKFSGWCLTGICSQFLGCTR